MEGSESRDKFCSTAIVLKSYLIEKNISMSALSESSKIPYSLLNSMVNGQKDLANVAPEILHELIKAIGISMDEFYDIWTNHLEIYNEENDVMSFVTKEGTDYCLDFTYKGVAYREVMCTVNDETTMFIKSVASWQLEKYLIDIKMEEAYALCIKTKR